MEVDEAVALVPGSVGSYLSAAVALGAEPLPREPAHVTVPRRLHVRPVDGVVIHRSDLAGADRIIRRGVPITSALRTARDCGSLEDPVVAVVVLDTLVRLGRVRLLDLQTMAAEARGPGSGRLRTAIGRCEVSGSGLETTARLLLRQAGIAVVPQFRLAGWGHPFDFAIPWARVLIEIDGFGYHRSRGDLARDAAHANEAALAGWTLLRFTWEDVTLHPERMIATVRAAVEAC